MKEEGLRLVEFARPEEVEVLVDGLAARIRADYAGRNPVLVCVLKGAFIFMSDLVKRLDMPLEVDFVRASSYGDGTESCGTVRLTKHPEIELAGRDVIIIEDIVDTGRTLDAIVAHVRDAGAGSVAVCALLDKPSRRVVECCIDYAGMEVDDHFLVGYGLDCAERYRNLAGLYLLEESGKDYG